MPPPNERTRPLGQGDALNDHTGSGSRRFYRASDAAPGLGADLDPQARQIPTASREVARSRGFLRRVADLARWAAV